MRAQPVYAHTPYPLPVVGDAGLRSVEDEYSAQLRILLDVMLELVKREVLSILPPRLPRADARGGSKGEGSRGGHVVGHYPSGAPKYGSPATPKGTELVTPSLATPQLESPSLVSRPVPARKAGSDWKKFLEEFKSSGPGHEFGRRSPWVAEFYGKSMRSAKPFLGKAKSLAKTVRRVLKKLPPGLRSAFEDYKDGGYSDITGHFLREPLEDSPGVSSFLSALEALPDYEGPAYRGMVFTNKEEFFKLFASRISDDGTFKLAPPQSFSLHPNVARAFSQAPYSGVCRVILHVFNVKAKAAMVPADADKEGEVITRPGERFRITDMAVWHQPVPDQRNPTAVVHLLLEFVGSGKKKSRNKSPSLRPDSEDRKEGHRHIPIWERWKQVPFWKTVRPGDEESGDGEKP